MVLRSRNTLGYSPNATSVVIRTKPSSIRVKNIPIIERAYYMIDRRRLGFQLKDDRRSLLFIDEFCLQFYDINSDDELLPCTPLRSIRVSDREFEVDIETMNLRLKLCFINESEICSKSLSVPTGLAVTANSSDWILILIGKIFALLDQCWCVWSLWSLSGAILGLCLVIVLLGLCLCLDHRRRKEKSKNGSTDTLKTNSDQLNSISVRVSDTSPSQLAVVRSKTHYYPHENTGVYSIHGKTKFLSVVVGFSSRTLLLSIIVVLQVHHRRQVLRESHEDWDLVPTICNRVFCLNFCFTKSSVSNGFDILVQRVNHHEQKMNWIESLFPSFAVF